ncbi:zinc finger, C2H2 type [Teladorsagia circumcincta]|uniref:Zinc finger, C2H2 type n=1 Tax=Teladorsagia circumcincta TaxID=45464 RepID=A0A2G9UML4_TELCI|nr:zinc finger, C2H2 type [Teladorsagia circumcincta]
MQQGAWRIPFAGFTPAQPQPLFRSTWQQPSSGEWTANNNKINEWKKWNSLETPSTELVRPRPQLLSPHFGSPVLPTSGQATLPTVGPTTEVTADTKPCEPMDQHDIHILKEEERKSAEHHSASYDASASPSLSGDEDERRLDVEGSSEPHAEDVEVDVPKTSTELRMQCSVDYETDEGHPYDNDDNHVSTTTSNKEDEASHLLLNFSQQSFASSSDQSRLQCLSSPTESASFCRPPGLGPAAFCTPTTGQNAALVCPICGFSCNSKFHYNSHMNTHGDHQCSMCDYTSRTEGRLKKHMRESHTVEEQLAVGLEIKPPTPAPSSSTATSTVTTTSQCSALADIANLSTTMASLVDVANMAAAAVAVKQEFNNAEPRRNSNGKMKQYKCKQCPHISFSKDDQWAHARTHIPVDKQMNCPTCNFVTEYKHHLLHLKKYDHRRVPDGMEMGDTSPTQVKPEALPPYSNFGMKLDAPSPTSTLAQTLGLSPIVTSQSLNYASQMLLRQHQMEQMSSLINSMPTLPQPLTCAVCDFQTNSQEELMRHNVNHFLNQSNQSPIVSLYQSLPQVNSFIPPLEAIADKPVSVDTQEERDSGHVGDDEMEGSTGSTSSPHCSSKAYAGSGDEVEQPGRKIKAFKLEQISQRLQGKSPTGSEDSDEKEAAKDQALYHIHMGYHGYEHVFKCNRCGHIAPDSLNFNLHLLQASHE